MADQAGGNGFDVERLRALAEGMRERHRTAQERVLAATREAILEGILAPGTRLRQEDLAAVFATSRIPVREALRALEYEGLVTSEPHRGFAVTSLDADEVQEVYELRAVLEGYAVRMAVPLLTDADVADLERLYAEMEQAAEGQAADAALAKREEFYRRLYGVTARPRLIGLIDRLRHDVARSLRWQRVGHSADHAAFFQAVKDGDGDRAAEELARHYQRVVALIQRFLREAKYGATPLRPPDFTLPSAR